MGGHRKRIGLVGGLVAMFICSAVLLPVSSQSTHTQASLVNTVQKSRMAKVADPYGVNWTASPPDGNNGWYRHPVTLTCTYDHDIVAEVDYRYTGTEWQMYTTPFNISTQGIIEFEWYCVFTNGTVSRPQGPFHYYLDWTPPEVEVETHRYWNKIVYTVEVEDSYGLLDRVEFWVGPYLQFTQVFTDPSGDQTVTWILQPIPHISVNITIKIYDQAGNAGYMNMTSCYRSLRLSLLEILFDNW